MTDYTELKRLAETATQGDWTHWKHGVVKGGPSIQFANGSGQQQIVMTTGAEWMRPGEQYANADFIAAANPAAVLALIAENEALRKDAERWRFFSVLANDLQAFPHSWGQMTPEKMDFMCDEAMAAAMSEEPQP